MKPLRLLPPLLALCGAALGLSACNAGLSDAAAQVDNTAISRTELNATLAAMTSNTGFACVISGGNAKLTSGAGNSYPAAFAAQILTTLVEAKALARQAAAAHLSVTPFARTVAKAQLLQAFQPGQSSDQSCTTPAATILATLAPSVRNQLIELQANQDLLAAHASGVTLSASGVATWVQAHRAAATISCLELAPFPTASEAGAFASAVGGGTSFQSAAAAVGTQPQAGCVQAANLPAGIASAIGGLKVGGLSRPISYSGSYLIIQLTSRRVATGTEAAQLLLQASAAGVAHIVADALSRVSVSVDPAYGRWQRVSTTYQVVPPTGPSGDLLFNAAAVGAAPAASGTSGLPGAG